MMKWVSLQLVRNSFTVTFGWCKFLWCISYSSVRFSRTFLTFVLHSRSGRWV